MRRSLRCAAGETHATAIAIAIAIAIDGVAPTTLELTARKERAARIGTVQVDSVSGIAAALRAVIPPEAALAYHTVLIASADEYIAALEEQNAAIARAASAQQIAVANAQARFRVQATDREVAAIAVNLPPQVTGALDQQPGCRPQPGTPGIRPPGGT